MEARRLEAQGKWYRDRSKRIKKYSKRSSKPANLERHCSSLSLHPQSNGFGDDGLSKDDLVADRGRLELEVSKEDEEDRFHPV